MTGQSKCVHFHLDVNAGYSATDLAALWGKKDVFDYLASEGGTVTRKFRRALEKYEKMESSFTFTVSPSLSLFLPPVQSCQNVATSLLKHSIFLSLFSPLSVVRRLST